MNRDQVWTIGSLLISVVVLAGGYFLGIAPLFTQAALTDAERVSAEAQAAGYQTTLSTLKEKYANIETLRADVAGVRDSIPAESDMSQFIGGLDLTAQSTGSQILSVTVTDALPYVPPVVVAPDVPAPPADGAAESTEATAAAPVETAPVVSSNPLIPNADLVSAANMAIIPVTISITGTFDQNTAFVGSLQSGTRIFLVTRLTSTQDTDEGIFSTEIEGYVYVVLTADAAAAVAASPSAATAAAG